MTARIVKGLIFEEEDETLVPCYKVGNIGFAFYDEAVEYAEETGLDLEEVE